MKIHLLLKNQKFGPYDLNLVKKFLEEARISESDLAWTTGKSDWQPIGDLISDARLDEVTSSEDEIDKIHNLIQEGETEFAFDLAKSLNCKKLFGKLLEGCCIGQNGSLHLSSLYSSFRGDLTLFFKFLSIAPQGTPLCSTLKRENFTSLKFENSGLEELSFLESFIQLEKLEFTNCSSLKNFEALAKLPNLKTLEISDFGYNSFKDLSSLSNISVTALKISNCSSLVDISALSSFPNLRSLTINKCNSLSEMSVLSNLPNLQTLDLSGCSSLKDEEILRSSGAWNVILPSQFFPKLTYYERVPQLFSKIYYITEDFIEQSPFETLEELQQAREESSEEWEEFLSDINGYFDPDDTEEDWQDTIYDEWEYSGPSV